MAREVYGYVRSAENYGYYDLWVPTYDPKSMLLSDSDFVVVPDNTKEAIEGAFKNRFPGKGAYQRVRYDGGNVHVLLRPALQVSPYGDGDAMIETAVQLLADSGADSVLLVSKKAYTTLKNIYQASVYRTAPVVARHVSRPVSAVEVAYAADAGIARAKRAASAEERRNKKAKAKAEADAAVRAEVGKKDVVRQVYRGFSAVIDEVAERAIQGSGMCQRITLHTYGTDSIKNLKATVRVLRALDSKAVWADLPAVRQVAADWKVAVDRKVWFDRKYNEKFPDESAEDQKWFVKAMRGCLRRSQAVVDAAKRAAPA